MHNFDYMYDPPEGPEPSKESEEVWEMLEKAEVEEAVIQEVVERIEKLVAAASRECPECERRAAEEEAKVESAASEYRDEELLAIARHIDEATSASADLAYDAARERRYR